MDEVFDALANRHRRRVLLRLLERNPQPELVDDAPFDVGRTDGEDRVELVHVHLPKLESMGFIAWDRDDHLIVKGPAFEEIRPLLELVEENEHALPDDLV